MQEISHVLEVLKEARKALHKEDVIKLKELSNETIHASSIYQDIDNIFIAVIIYSTSKILERTYYKDYKQWPGFIKALKKHLDTLILSLEKQDLNKFRFEVKRFRKNISNLSGNFKSHVLDVFQKAEINKASRIYEHGISLEKTAGLLGISIWELAEYTGQTGISNVSFNKTLSVKSRISLAMELFR